MLPAPAFTQLQETLGATQQTVSTHLGVLLRAGLVSRTKVLSELDAVLGEAGR